MINNLGVFLTLFFLSFSAIAGTVAATQKTAGQHTIAASQGYQGPGPSGAVVYSSFTEACNAVRTYPYGVLPKGNCTDGPERTPWSNGSPAGVCYYNTSGTNCAGMTSAEPTMAYKCPVGYHVTGSQCVNDSTVYICPSGYTGPTLINGQQMCTNSCLEGESVSQASYFGGWRVGTAPNALVGPNGQSYFLPPPSEICDGTCAITMTSSGTCTSNSRAYVDIPQEVHCVGTGTKTGASCSVNSNAPTGAVPTIPNHRPVCAAGEGVLTSSSGTVACVPSGVPGATPVVQNSKTSETFPDGSSKTIETTKTTNPVDGTSDQQIKTTITPATGGGGGMAGTPGVTYSGTSSQGDKTAAEKEPQKGVCELEPNSPMCKIGTPGAPGSFGSMTSEVESKKAAFQAKFQEVKAGISALIAANVSGGAGGLPCRPPITVLGKSISLCFSDYELQLAVIGQFVVLLGALSALFIVFGGGRRV